MRYIIYGANRVAKDFIYMFDNLEIEGVVDPDYGKKTFAGYPVFCEEVLSGKDPDSRIIVCDFDKKQKERRLGELGLYYGTDYCFDEDFFSQLDTFHIPENRKIAIWGTGKAAEEFCGLCPEYEPELFIDTYAKKAFFQGKQVVSPATMDEWEKWFIIICIVKDSEIRKCLMEKGLRETVDFTGYQTLTGMPSKLLRRTIFDKAYYDLECNTMHNHLEIIHDGNTRCCCTTFVCQDLDNMMKNSLEEVWHSNRHKVMCLSAENRTYSFCDTSMCPLFVAKEKKDMCEGMEREYKKMEKFPHTLALGYDATCNLSCVTCRTGPYVARGKEFEEVTAISEKIKKIYIPHCKFLILAGDGEVFLSPAYKDIYQDKNCDPEYIRLLSNGMLFHEENWKEFIRNKTGKIMLTVSIDAAKKETYEKIRKNGRFDVLQKNMEFASQLRKSGALQYFRINFVVQRENYQEMPAFTGWGERLGVDEVFFTKILNWGTYSEEEFEKISMMEKDGITPKPELQAVMELPDMKSALVDMGTIQYGHKADDVDIVENYYMWELEKRGGRIFQ